MWGVWGTLTIRVLKLACKHKNTDYYKRSCSHTLNPNERHILTNHAADVYSVAFSHDAKRMASGSKDGKIILWDAQTFEPIPTTLFPRR